MTESPTVRSRTVDLLSRLSTPSRRPAQLLIGIGLLGVFVIFGIHVWLTSGRPVTQPIDNAWRSWIGAGPKPPHSVLAAFFHEFGELPGIVVMLIVIPIALAIVGRWRSAVFVASAGLLSGFAVTQGVKHLVDRPRPADDLTAGLFGPLVPVDHGSFPSGHSLAVAVFAVVIAALLPRRALPYWWIIASLLMVGMVWQRTMVNAHWLSDCIFGLIGGVGCALVVPWAYAPMLARDRGRRLFNRAPVTSNSEGDVLVREGTR